MWEAQRQINIEAFLRDLAGGINACVNDNLGKMGFALILFDFNEPGVGNYISNADCSDMIAVLRETADRIEKNQDLPPATTTRIQ